MGLGRERCCPRPPAQNEDRVFDPVFTVNKALTAHGGGAGHVTHGQVASLAAAEASAEMGEEIVAMPHDVGVSIMPERSGTTTTAERPCPVVTGTRPHPATKPCSVPDHTASAAGIA